MRGQVAETLRRRLSGKPRAHFLHVSKTGGTALMEGLRPQLHRGRYAVVLHPHETRLQHIPPGEAFFFSLRDPADRFRSAFGSRRRGGRPRYDRPPDAGERAVFERFASASALGEALGSADPTAREEAEAAMGALALVEPQVSWLGSTEQLEARRGDLLLVLFQEELEHDTARLAERLGVSISLPRDPAAAHRAPPGDDVALSDEARRNLLAWYARDVELLARCRELRPDPIG